MVRCTLTEMQPGKVYSLTVEFPPGFKPAPTGDRVTLKTDIETMPTVTIPITMQGGSASGPLPGMIRPPVRDPVPPAPPTGGGVSNPPVEVKP